MQITNQNNHETWLIYSMFASRDEAISAARALLSEQMIACANIISGATSVYRWEGKVEEAAEVVMMAKTSRHALPHALERLRALHSYQLPCIEAWPIEAGNREFLHWVAQETLKG